MDRPPSGGRQVVVRGAATRDVAGPAADDNDVNTTQEQSLRIRPVVIHSNATYGPFGPWCDALVHQTLKVCNPPQRSEAPWRGCPGARF